MSIDSMTLGERQCFEMIRACMGNGVSAAFIRDAVDRLEPKPAGGEDAEVTSGPRKKITRTRKAP